MPLAVDLFCGLGGWTEGLQAEGYRVVGFDVERHVYGEARYPAQLVIQDVLTLHGSQFKDAALIVASPPCQAYSYMAMPWSRAKQIAREYEDGTRDVRQLTALFDACFRIQREANEAVRHYCKTCGVFMLSHHAWTQKGACSTFVPDDRYIPLVVENVRGAQRWVGRSRWNFGSFHLWGDVPALMPMTTRAGEGMKIGDRNVHRASGGHKWSAHWTEGIKVPTMGAGWYPPGHPKHVKGLAFNGHAERGCKVSGDWFGSYAEQKASGTISPGRMHGKGSVKRKAASAMIAKIPLTLSRHIARSWHPECVA